MGETQDTELRSQFVCERLLFFPGVGLRQLRNVKESAGRIGNDRPPAAVCVNVPINVDRAAELFDAADGGVDIGDVEVRQPDWLDIVEL